MPNEILDENTILVKEYEEKLAMAVANYKQASKKMEFAFDSYDEECIKEEMDSFKNEVKSLRSTINELTAKDSTNMISQSN
ncbi:MAG: hypothetical protein ACO29X_04640 [Arcobacteraceae bacterium]|jgi:hypothetical protein